MNFLSAVLFVASFSALAAPTITVRTESFPRPPYSSATYYFYEKDGLTLCTKLKVCNKFDECEVSYHKGPFLDSLDYATGAPYSRTDAVVIPTSSLKKHRCLR